MNKETYTVIGVMSGTSLDGVDLALIHFEIKNQKWTYQIFDCETIGYSESWIYKLKNAVSFSNEELESLNSDYTLLLSTIIQDFITKYEIKNLDAVCSHGHTILHQPQNGFTLQIGNLPQIADLSKQIVVCDFRVQDVSLGGQGAPLVPIGDQILFPSFDYCLNLGGFSNISFEKENTRLAFDISPVNTVLNYYAKQLGFDYDDQGQLSREGNIDTHLLQELNQLDFYQKKHPKSLGFEFVKEIILPLIENYQIPVKDKLKTFSEHIAIQIALALPTKKGSLLITGGGAYNTFLIERIQFHLKEVQIIIPENKTIEFKEALIFALLGVLRLRNETNVLASVTGALKNHSSGVIFNPK